MPDQGRVKELRVGNLRIRKKRYRHSVGKPWVLERWDVVDWDDDDDGFLHDWVIVKRFETWEGSLSYVRIGRAVNP